MHLSDAAKAVYQITAAMGKLENRRVYCEDNGTWLNVYQVDAVESDFFRLAAASRLRLPQDPKYKLH